MIFAFYTLYLIVMLEKPKTNKIKLSVTIEPDILKVLEEYGFNRSKLINKLLKTYLNKKTKR